jgi:hypothetical protein
VDDVLGRYKGLPKIRIDSVSKTRIYLEGILVLSSNNAIFKENALECLKIISRN